MSERENSRKTEQQNATRESSKNQKEQRGTSNQKNQKENCRCPGKGRHHPDAALFLSPRSPVPHIAELRAAVL